MSSNILFADGVAIGGDRFTLNLDYDATLEADTIRNMDFRVWSAERGWHGDLLIDIIRDHPNGYTNGFSGSSEDHQFYLNSRRVSFRSILPDSFQLALDYGDRKMVSGVFRINKWKVAHTYEWKVNPDGFTDETPVMGSAGFRPFLACLVATIMLEFLVVLIWSLIGKTTRRVLWISVLANLLTLLPLWLVSLNGWLPLGIGELLVVLIEGYLYWRLTRKQKKLYTMLLLSLVANVISYSVTAIGFSLL